MTSVTTPTDFWSRVLRWWRGRDWKTAPRWSPAVIAAVGVLCVGVWCLHTSAQEIEARYLNEAKTALQVKAYPHAMTCLERVAPTAEDRPEVLYRMALTAEAASDHARVATLIRELAPDDRKGYAPAHYWRARKFLTVVPQTPRMVAAAEAHLLRALDGELDDREPVHGLLGSIYLAAGRLDEAEFHLSKAAALNPVSPSRIPLARLYYRRGTLAHDRQEADAAGRFFAQSRQEAEVAVRGFRDRCRSDPANVQMRLAWVDAVTFQEDFAAAIGILEEGEALSASPVYPVVLARVYVAWYDVRKKAAGATPAELVGLIDKGLSRDPGNKDLLDRLIEQLRIKGQGVEPARKLLQDLLAKGGTALGPVHFALAVDARLRGDAAVERMHLEQAFRQDPKTGLIANNLAWVLSEPPAPDYPRALDVVNVALGHDPANLNYLGTRGRIYLGMGRWDDAIADLEAVLAKRPDAADLHPALAEAYEKAGLKSLAEEHRALAEAAAKKPAASAAKKKER